MSYIYTAAATLLALLLYMSLSFGAGQARARYRIKAPAVTGHENFERALPGADEHCRTNGVLPAGAVAVRRAAVRQRRRSRRIDLGHRPRPLCGLLSGRTGKAWARHGHLHAGP